MSVFGLAMAGAAAAHAAAPPAPSPEALEHFEKKIRPALVAHCYKCHSAETGKRKGGLQLDTREGLLRGGDSGAAIVPGDPDKSLLIKAIRRSSKDLEMPPDDPLPADVVADFVAWVKAGAADPRSEQAPPKLAADPEAARRHWAFQRPKDPPLPACGRKGACPSPVDNFVLAKLADKGLEPAPPADRRTLIRRATFDLWGLPPTQAEIDAFLADRSPHAFARLVERLLASPRYGERWGRAWLDVARYSDTKGYVFREERRFPFAFAYRDWVIRAFNEDLPYDKFLVQQIAADRLELGKDRRALAAMGFLTLGRRFLNRLPDIIDDRIDVLTRGTMALTVSCARCHDHKYDPIPTRDYYSLYGVLASSEEPKELPVIAAARDAKEARAFARELTARKAAVQETRAKKHAELMAALRQPKALEAQLLAAFEVGKVDDDEDLVKTLAQKIEITGYLIKRWKAFLKATAEPQHPLHQELAVLRDRATKKEAAAAAVEKIASAIATSPDLPARYRPIFGGPGAPLDVPVAEVDKICNRADREKIQDLERKIDELKLDHAGAPLGAHVLVDAAKPHDPRVFIRGNPDNLGDPVPRQFLAALAGDKRQPFREGSGRLELARAIASAENPLTARVLVNRLWLQHFGAGLVRTPSDFGLRSEPPTHPELLDFLARRFVEGGWSVKKLHRTIMLSAAYQQASEPAPGVRDKDPDNLLVSRQSRRRLDFEAMRDALLFSAGRLDATIGGRAVPFVSNPSAKTKQEAETVRNVTEGDPSQDVFARRRSVYLFIDRQNLPGVLRDFDFASPDTHSPQRYTTSVPQQALFLMNSPFVVEQARALVARPEVARERDPERRVQALYRLLYGRAARGDEVTLARRYLEAAMAPRPEPLSADGPPAATWLYGIGKYDATQRRVAAFAPLPHFTGMAWQGGAKLPDPMLGWAMLSASGGHPGGGAERAVIRRWVAPRDGEITVAGSLSHAAEKGDGIEARIVSSRLGELASFTARNSDAETKISRLEVKQGDAIDFVVDCRGEESFDGFAWAPTVRMKTVSAATGAEMMVEWSASGEFAGPPGKNQRAMSAWEKYAQALLVSNEFMFVD